MYNSNNSTIIWIITLILGFATLEWCPGTTPVISYYFLLFLVLYELFEIITGTKGGTHYFLLFFAQNLWDNCHNSLK